MVRMRKSPSIRERMAITNPIVAAATLMVDVRLDGTLQAVLGRLDLTTRRYTFVRPSDDTGQLYTAKQLPLALHHVAMRCWMDFVEAPFEH